MKKSILNMGKALNKADQKQINGGRKLVVSEPDCATAFQKCDKCHPDDYNAFAACMAFEGC